jgi:hypothetical protein
MLRIALVAAVVLLAAGGGSLPPQVFQPAG